jgi:hypothetical protein
MKAQGRVLYTGDFGLCGFFRREYQKTDVAQALLLAVRYQYDLTDHASASQ